MSKADDLLDAWEAERDGPSTLDVVKERVGRVGRSVAGALGAARDQASSGLVDVAEDVPAAAEAYGKAARAPALGEDTPDVMRLAARGLQSLEDWQRENRVAAERRNQDYRDHLRQYKQPSAPQSLDEWFVTEEANQRLPVGLLKRMGTAESGLDPGAVSAKGARGLMQLMPGTAKELGVSDPHDPGQAIAGAGRYMRQLMDQFGGNTEMAVAAYNWGPGNVSRVVEASHQIGDDWRSHLPAETTRYLGKVLGSLRERLSADRFGLPLSPGFEDAVRARWDASEPAQRAAMVADGGILGRVARDIDRQYRGVDALALPAEAQAVDTRIEDRALSYRLQGMEPQTAMQFARRDALLGVASEKLGQARSTTFDFERAEALRGASPFARGLDQGVIGLKDQAAGLNLLAADFADELGVPGAKDYARAQRQARDKLAMRGLELGEAPGDFERNLEGAVASTVSNAPALVAGLFTGGEVLPLLGMSMQVVGDEYASAIEDGQPKAQALERAIAYGAAEFLGEKVGFRDQVDLLKRAAGGNWRDFEKHFVKTLAEQNIGEQFTSAAEFGIDKAPGIGLNQQATAADYWQQVKDTFAQTTIQTALMGVPGAAQAYRGRLRELDRKPQGSRLGDVKVLGEQNGAGNEQEEGGGDVGASRGHAGGDAVVDGGGGVRALARDDGGRPGGSSVAADLARGGLVGPGALRGGEPEGAGDQSGGAQSGDTGVGNAALNEPWDTAAPAGQAFEENEYDHDMDGFSREMLELAHVVEHYEPGAGEQILEQGAINGDSNEVIKQRLQEHVRRVRAEEAAREQGAEAHSEAARQDELAAARTRAAYADEGGGIAAAPSIQNNGGASAPVSLSEESNARDKDGVVAGQSAVAPVRGMGGDRDAALSARDQAAHGVRAADSAPIHTADAEATKAGEPGQDGVAVFVPTHELPNGARVVAVEDEKNVWRDAQGTEYEDENATPLSGDTLEDRAGRGGKAAPAPDSVPVVSPAERDAPKAGYSGAEPGAGPGDSQVDAVPGQDGAVAASEVWDKSSQGTPAPSWWKKLTPAGRGLVIDAARIKRGKKRYWWYFSPSEREALERAGRAAYPGMFEDASSSSPVPSPQPSPEGRGREGRGDDAGLNPHLDEKKTNDENDESIAASVPQSSESGAGKQAAAGGGTAAKTGQARSEGETDGAAEAEEVGGAPSPPAPLPEGEGGKRGDEKGMSLETVKAREDLKNALADLGQVFLDAGLFSKKAVPNAEIDEAKLIPVLTRVLDASFRLGYHSFKASARFALTQIREHFGDAPADAITLDHVQGAYIAMAGKYRGKGADSKRDVVGFESLDDVLRADEGYTSGTQSTGDEHERGDQFEGPASVRADESEGGGGDGGGTGAGAASGRPEGRAEAGDDRRDTEVAESDLGTGGGKPLGQDVAEADEETGGRPGKAAEGAGKRGGAVGKGPAVRGGKRLGGGNREPATVRDRPDEPAAGVVSEPIDHVIADEDEIGAGGPKAKFRGNVAAIRLLKTLEDEDRRATAAEQKTLARYVGWGGLKQAFDPDNASWAREYAELRELLSEDEYAAARRSMLDAHYTSPEVVKAMWGGLEHLGFSGGSLLEPSIGIGNFIGLMPANLRNKTNVLGVELDRLTSSLVQQLYPNANIAGAKGFQEVKIPSNSLDAAVGNPPFGSQSLYDPDHPELKKFSIHNFFFAKTLDKLRPGGVMSMVVSRYLMDALDPSARLHLAKQARFLGAVRLPYSAFLGNAGTEVVTDIIFLQKRDAPVSESEAAEQWTDTGEITLTHPKTGDAHTFNINGYYLENPDNVLGLAEPTGKMQGSGNNYNVAPRAGEELADVLASALRRILPAGVYKAGRGPVADAVNLEAIVPDGLHVGGYFVTEDGRVMQRGEDYLNKSTARPVELSKQVTVKRVAGLLGVRDAVIRQLRAELDEHATEPYLETLRKNLNEVYDKFVKTYGYINSQTNRRALYEDPKLPLLESLEPGYDRGISDAVAKKKGVSPRAPSAKKAAIFERRVLVPQTHVDRVESAQDALVASQNERGGVDTHYMAQVYGKSWDEIAAELGDRVFLNPDGGWETADQYLSGNVKFKLERARSMAEEDAKYRRNVEALEAVQPPRKTYDKIFVKLGSPWVPGDVVRDFAASLYGGQSRAVYVPQLARWTFEHTGGGDTVARTATYGTADYPADEIIEHLLNNKAVVVKRNLGTSKEPNWVVDESRTEAARAKADEVAAKFREWVWLDAERREALENLYNDKYNVTRRRTYDGSHLVLPGSNPNITLRPHQAAAVWRGVQDRIVLLDHVVGAGKTMEMTAIAMEMRRLGILKKPMFLVPKHLIGQWRDEFYALYPNANVLAATEQDFEKGNRERLMARIATGDWDAVIVGHTSFKKIAMPAEAEKRYLDEQVQELADAIEEMKRERGDRNVVRDMERIKERLEARIKALADTGAKDKAVSFDELGVDGLFVDEAHLFKNLFFYTQMQNVAGLGNPAGSQRAFDLFIKIRHLQDRFADRGVTVFATGTPVSNSLVEMYTMQRYLQWSELKRRGLHLLDAWAGTFGDVQNVYEVHPSGSGYRLKERFQKFVSVPALMDMYKSFADSVTLDDLKAQAKARGGVFPVPRIKGDKPRNVVAQRSALQTRFFGVPEFVRGAQGEIAFKYPTDLVAMEDEKTGFWQVVSSSQTYIKQGPFETRAEAEDQRDVMLREALTQYNEGSILWKFENLKELNKKSKGKINALSITNEARKAGLDYRLIDPSAPDDPGSKINQAVAEIARIHKAWTGDKGAQLVFCDLSVPKSERGRLASSEREVFVRDGDTLKPIKATIYAPEGYEGYVFYVQQVGRGAKQRTVLYDAVSGARLVDRELSKAAVLAGLDNSLASGNGVSVIEDKRAEFGPLTEDQIADWKAQQESDGDEGADEEGGENVSLGELLAVSGGRGGFSVYDDVKAKLIARGVAEDEIAFIHDADTVAKKQELFRRVRSGEVRVLLGSTEKMGAGMNVQERLVALHHLDAPWRPSDLEQREGRIVRQGNELYKRDPDGFEVEILRYATEQTYDTRMWQILEHKAAGVEQLRKAGDDVLELEDIGGEAANAADMKAAASGNPLILEEIRLRNEVKALEGQEFGHRQAVIKHQQDAKYAAGARKRGDKAKARLRPYVQAAGAHPVEKDKFAFVVDGKRYDERKAAGEAFVKRLKQAVKAHIKGGVPLEGAKHGWVPMGEFRGVGVWMSAFTDFSGNIALRAAILPAGVPAGLDMSDAMTVGDYGAADDFSFNGLVTRINNTLANVGKEVDGIDADVVKQEASIPRLEELARAPFAKAEALTAARRKQREVASKLAKAGGAVEMTPAMRQEYDEALRERLRGVKFSRTETRRKSGFSVSAIEKAVRAGLGEAVVPWLESGRLSVVQGAEGLAAALGRGYRAEDLRGVHAAYISGRRGGEGRIVLVADGLNPRVVRGVALHELFHAALAENPELARRHYRLMKSLALTRRVGLQHPESGLGRWVAGADEAVRKARPDAADALEEFGAYALEQFEHGGKDLPARVVYFAKQFLALVRAGLQRLGIYRPRTVRPADLSLIAREWLREGVKAESGSGEAVLRYSHANHADDFASQVDAVLDGEGTGAVLVGEAPPALVQAGLPRAPMMIKESVIDKIHYDHGLSRDKIKALPDRLARPIMVFKSDTQAGSFVVLTDMEQSGSPVIVAIKPNGEIENIRPVNLLTSAYGKPAGVIRKWIEKGLLIASDKNKALAFATTNGLRLPAVIQTIRKSYALKIGQVDENVKPDAKFSQQTAPEDNEDLFAEIDAAASSGAWDRAKRVFWDDWDGLTHFVRRQKLGGLTVRQLTEIGAEILPRMAAYTKLTDAMARTRHDTEAEADDVARAWQKLGNVQMARVAAVMHESTLVGVDPSVPYKPLIEPKEAAKKIALLNNRLKSFQPASRDDVDLQAKLIEERQELRRTLAQERKRAEQRERIDRLWQGLSASAQAVYVQARDFHEDVLNTTEAELVKMIQESGADGRTKAAKVAALKKEFETLRVNAPYFPLGRQGDFWVSLKPGSGGNNEFHTFRTDRARQDFIKQAVADGGTILGRGKQFENLRELTGVPLSFVTSVEEAIGKTSLMFESPIVRSLRDEIWQLYLHSLPELSARRHMIHRKKTPGFGKDALRAFAEKAWHDGYYLARVKHGRHLQRLLEDLKADVQAGSADGHLKAARARMALLNEFKDDVLGKMSYTDVVEHAEFLKEKARLDESQEAEAKKWQEFARYLLAWSKGENLGGRVDEEIASLEQRVDTALRIRRAQHGDEKASNLYDELEQAYAHLMSPNAHPVAQLLNQFGFAFFLGFSPAAWITNALQTPLISMPWVASRVGVRNASWEFSKAYLAFFGQTAHKPKDEDSIRFSVREKLRGVDLEAFDEAEGNNVFGATRGHDLAGVAGEGAARAGWHRTVADAMAFGFHHAERMNREVTFVATVRAARKAGKPEAEARALAAEAVWATHFDYSAENRARFMRSNLARVVLQFKAYGQGVAYLYARAFRQAIKGMSQDERRAARKYLALQMGVQTLAAGLMGLPWVAGNAAFVLAAAFADDDDDPEDWNRLMRETLAEFAGSAEGGEILAKGALSWGTGVDWHGRLSQSELFLRDADREVEGKDGLMLRLGELAFGAMGGVASNVAVGASLMSDGETWRGIEKMVPVKGGRDLLKAARYAGEGVKNLKGDRLVSDLSGGELFGQALGFTPARVSGQYDENNAKQRLTERLQTRRGKLLARMNDARAENDERRMDEAREAIEAWNSKNPNDPITGKTQKQSWKTFQRNRAQAKGGVVTPKKYRERFEQAFDYAD